MMASGWAVAGGLALLHYLRCPSPDQIHPQKEYPTKGEYSVGFPLLPRLLAEKPELPIEQPVLPAPRAEQEDKPVLEGLVQEPAEASPELLEPLHPLASEKASPPKLKDYQQERKEEIERATTFLEKLKKEAEPQPTDPLRAQVRSATERYAKQVGNEKAQKLEHLFLQSRLYSLLLTRVDTGLLEGTFDRNIEDRLLDVLDGQFLSYGQTNNALVFHAAQGEETALSLYLKDPEEYIKTANRYWVDGYKELGIDPFVEKLIKFVKKSPDRVDENDWGTTYRKTIPLSKGSTLQIQWEDNDRDGNPTNPDVLELIFQGRVMRYNIIGEKGLNGHVDYSVGDELTITSFNVYAWTKARIRLHRYVMGAVEYLLKAEQPASPQD